MPFKKGNKLYRKRKVSFKGENNPFFGKKHNEEAKNRQRDHWKYKYANGYINWNKDKKNNYSKETLQKMKDAKKDYVPWNKDMNGEDYLSHYKDGKTWIAGLTKETDERVAKYSKKLKGREFSEETKKKISESRWGADNPAWQGGLSFEPYGYEFNDKLKKQIRNRDNFTCQLCSLKENGRHLNVHHIDYDKKNNIPTNLILLCPSCHTKTNQNREYWSSFFVHKQIDKVLIH